MTRRSWLAGLLALIGLSFRSNQARQAIGFCCRRIERGSYGLYALYADDPSRWVLVRSNKSGWLDSKPQRLAAAIDEAKQIAAEVKGL